MKMRIEKDSLGPREVPAGAYYGIQTQRAIENYPISGYRVHSQLIRAIGMVKKAAAMANRELKLLDAKRVRAHFLSPFDFAVTGLTKHIPASRALQRGFVGAPRLGKTLNESSDPLRLSGYVLRADPSLRGPRRY